MSIQLGITRLLAEPAPPRPAARQARRPGRPRGVGGRAVPLDASTCSSARQDDLGFRLTALFSPQHGFWGQDQDNMIETAHAQWKGVPLYSLYSETRKPTAAMLADVDAVVVDLQDIGTRIYTYVYTMSYVMEAAAELGKAGRSCSTAPTPSAASTIQGTTLDPAYRSFVGLYPMPTRHGLTIGEPARWMNDRHELNVGRRCALQVVPMTGWDRRVLLGRPGPRLRHALPQHPHPGERGDLPRLRLLRGHERVRGARHDAAPRAVRGALHPAGGAARPPRRESPGWQRGRLRARRPGSCPRSRSTRARSASASSSIRATARPSIPCAPGCRCCAASPPSGPGEFRWKQPPYEYETEKLAHRRDLRRALGARMGGGPARLGGPRREAARGRRGLRPRPPGVPPL